MAEVLPSLFLGGKDEAKNLEWLKSKRIVSIINCTNTKADDPTGIPNYHEKLALFKYQRFPFFDNASSPFLPVLEKALAAVDSARHYGPVFVHCAQGVSRSAAVVAGFLIKTHGLSLDAAIRLMREKRPQVKPNDAFMRHLAAYEEQIKAARAAGGLLPAEPLPLHSPSASDSSTAAKITPSAASSSGEGSERSAFLSSPSSRKRPRGPEVDSSSSSATGSENEAENKRGTPYAQPNNDGSGASSMSSASIGPQCGPSVPDATAEGGFSSNCSGHERDDGGPVLGRAPALCEECEGAPAIVQCGACSVAYCASCDQDAHAIASIGQHAGDRRPIHA